MCLKNFKSIINTLAVVFLFWGSVHCMEARVPEAADGTAQLEAAVDEWVAEVFKAVQDPSSLPVQVSRQINSIAEIKTELEVLSGLLVPPADCNKDLAMAVAVNLILQIEKLCQQNFDELQRFEQGNMAQLSLGAQKILQHCIQKAKEEEIQSFSCVCVAVSFICISLITGWQIAYSLAK
jgi:hypothetical protein